MFTSRVVALVCSVFWTATLLSQQSKAPSTSPIPQNFPVVFQQNVVAGKTPVGTKVQAKLETSTLVNGTVVPRNATFSGEVVESAAKTAGAASRLALRMDSVQWKNGSISTRVYLTPWYYPTIYGDGPNLQYGPEQPPSGRTWNGMGQYPDPNSPAYTPFPNSVSDKPESGPTGPSASTSHHRVLMKNVQCERDNNGAMALVSKDSNIKLDKVTTYVLAGEPPAAPVPAAAPAK